VLESDQRWRISEMRRLEVFAFVVVAYAMAGGATVFGQGIEKGWGTLAPEAPFQIPASGKPEEMVGGIQYCGPSGLAFDSLNRPYLLHTFRNGEGDTRPDLAGMITTWRDGVDRRTTALLIACASPAEPLFIWAQGCSG